MRPYLVSGFIYLLDGSNKPAARMVSLDDSELMDAKTVPTVQAHCLASLRAEFPDQAEIMASFVMTGFQMLEYADEGWVVESEVQLNACDVIMPPVESPLLIEIAPDVLLKATRRVHVEPRSASMIFELEAGGLYTGRPRWTHQ